MGATETSTDEGLLSRWRHRLQRLRLRFSDPVLESAFRVDDFRHHLANIRFAFLAGVGLLDRVGAAPAPLHVRPGRPETGPGHAVPRVHPDAGRRVRAHVHAILRADAGVGFCRDRNGDAAALGLLRRQRAGAARGVRIRRRHPDHRVHLHVAAPALHPRDADHGDRDRRVSDVRVHGSGDLRSQQDLGGALPGLVRLPGRVGCLSDGTVTRQLFLRERQLDRNAHGPMVSSSTRSPKPSSSSSRPHPGDGSPSASTRSA